MKRSILVKGAGSRRHVIVGRPTTLTAISFDDFYEDSSDRWQEKAKRLQARRWRKIRHQTA